MKPRLILVVSISLFAVALQGAIALSNGSVTATAHGPAGLRIEARGANLDLQEDDATLTFTAALAHLETGIDLRDRHLQKLLSTDAFPSSILRVPRSEIALPREGQPSEGVARGELTLRGRVRPIPIRYRADVVGRFITRVRGSFSIDVRDFDVAPPSYLGLAVSPQVEVEAELILTGRAQHAHDDAAPLLGVAAGAHR